MGISGLLPALQSITETRSLAEYRNQTLAIDGYCWLHRAVYTCSQEICLGEETDKYVDYFMGKVDQLLVHGIVPYVVFDGGPLPMKKGTELQRRKARERSRKFGIQCYNQKNFASARKYFNRAADVTPFMAHRIIQKLKEKDVLYVVAPYEADAQLAFLMQNELADAVITEDSDCLPFGCSTVLFKLDKDGDGLVQEIKLENLKKNAGDLNLESFTHDMFLEMCILSGCDYVASLPGLGLKTAYSLVKRHGSVAKVLETLRVEDKAAIPPTYEAEFAKAVLTFHHQRVYDPVTQSDTRFLGGIQQILPLTVIPESALALDVSMDFLGPVLSSSIAQGIASGDLDPMSKEKFGSSQVELKATKHPFMGTCSDQTPKKTPLLATEKSSKPAVPNLQQQQTCELLAGSLQRKIEVGFTLVAIATPLSYYCMVTLIFA